MKDKLLKAGTFFYNAYLKPAPMVACKAVLTTWIGTTIGTVIGMAIVHFRGIKSD